ncbi:MAG: 2-keto-3-deoxygluconate permease [Atopobiaceae bacterium]|jgi:2-keto-3-deoxygluconate permease|nr:2-keto-3-deoxygluconate permease [Atopobiaceae bacterium]
MAETAAMTASKKNSFWVKVGKLPGSNILVPLLLGCIINTVFPQVFALGSFTTAMTTNGTSPLVGAFLLAIGTTISFDSAPKAAMRGAILIVIKNVFTIVLALFVLYALGNNFFGLSAMVILAACTGANNAMYAGLMGDYGNEIERGAVAITTLVVGPPVTMVVLGAAGQAPIGWSLLGAVLPIIVGIILGNTFPTLKKKFSTMLPGLIIVIFFAMGSTMTLGQLVAAGLPGILLGLICSVLGAVINIFFDRLTGGTGVAGAAISSCAGANVATPKAMASVDEARYGGDVLNVATAQVAACAIVTAIVTPLITSWAYKRFEGNDQKIADEVKSAA